MTKPTDLQAAPTEAPMAEALHEPTTQAGKALLRSDFDTTGWGPRVVRRHVTEAILAIEAEAVAAERTRIAEAVSRATPVVFMPEDIERIYAGGGVVDLAAPRRPCPHQPGRPRPAGG